MIRAPLEIELLVTADQRRVTVEEHAEFRARMAADLSERPETAVNSAGFPVFRGAILTSGASLEGANGPNVRLPFSQEHPTPDTIRP